MYNTTTFTTTTPKRQADRHLGSVAGREGGEDFDAVEEAVSAVLAAGDVSLAPPVEATRV